MNTRKSNYLRIAIISLMLASLLPVASIVTTTFVPNFTVVPIAMATEEEDGIEYRDEDGNVVEREVEESDNELARDEEDAGYEAAEPIPAELDEAAEGIEPISAELDEEAEDIEAISAEVEEEADEAEATGFAWQVLVVIAALIVSGAGAFFFASKKKKDDPQVPQQ